MKYLYVAALIIATIFFLRIAAAKIFTDPVIGRASWYGRGEKSKDDS